LVNTPELEVNAPNNVSLAAISTPSTVPVTVIFPVTSSPAPTFKLPKISTTPLDPICNLSALPFVVSSIKRTPFCTLILKSALLLVSVRKI